MTPIAQDIQAGSIQDVADWTGRKFGELLGFRVIKNDIRILSHTGGFAVFLPGDFWRKLDHQVPIFIPAKKDASCWIAGKNFAYIKFDIDRKVVAKDDEYISDDVQVVLNKIESFVNKNFFDNPQAYPDSEYFTYGSMVDSPDTPRPFRMRLGGNFSYQL